MSIKLTAKQRSFLKSLGHKLKPVVWIGKNGLNDEVVNAIDKALEVDELIKIKIHEGAPVERKKAGPGMADSVNGTFVQVIGRVIILYRPFPEEPQIKLP